MVTTVARPQCSERVEKLRKRALETTHKFDCERTKFQLEVYKQTDGEPGIIRRAKLFEKLCSEKTIWIDENPFVGTLTRYLNGVYAFPEINCRWMRKVSEVHSHLGRVPLGEEDKHWLNQAVDYWLDRNIDARTRAVMLQHRGVDLVPFKKTWAMAQDTLLATMLTVPNNEKLLTKGYNGIIAEAEGELAKLDVGTFENIERFYFYQASIMCLKAMIMLARRYASLAREMAEQETDPERKQELKEVAEICEWVPANPARNFREALQSFWFTELGCWIESAWLNAPPGRFTQALFPFYKMDREKGMSEKEAIELIQLYFLKVNGLAKQLEPPSVFKGDSARLAMHLCLGGLTPDGKDATNDLDFLVLEAQQQLRMAEPNIIVFYHDRLSPEFLLKCVESIRTGIGQPSFENCDLGIQRALQQHGKEGMTLEEARQLAVFGCVQSLSQGCSDTYWEGVLNAPKWLELALNNGRDSLTGVQIGLETGEAESFQSYDELCQAVRKQMEYVTNIHRDAIRTSWNIAREFLQVPFGSSLVDDCIKKGKDQIMGGARYSIGTSAGAVGCIDLANSLAAIKKLVYEDKKVTIKQLKEALAANFEGDGYAEIQRMCLKAPKYGNDDDYVDSIVREWYDRAYEAFTRLPDFLGRPVTPQFFSVTIHSPMGEGTGALPSGRKARLPFCDGSVSAQAGTDVNGPTALVKSAAKAIDCSKAVNHFNMKFHPSALEGQRGAQNLIGLVKTYMDLGGWHVQFNCVSTDTLKDAQMHPDNYRDLVVRVAGFSAFFVHLDRPVQDEVIRRSEFRFA